MIRIDKPIEGPIVNIIPEIAIEIARELFCRPPPLVLIEDTPDALDKPTFQEPPLALREAIPGAFYATTPAVINSPPITYAAEPSQFSVLLSLAAICFFVIAGVLVYFTLAFEATQSRAQCLSIDCSSRYKRHCRRSAKDRRRRSHRPCKRPATTTTGLTDHDFQPRVITYIEFIQWFVSSLTWFASLFSPALADFLNLQLAPLKQLVHLIRYLLRLEYRSLARKSKTKKWEMEPLHGYPHKLRHRGSPIVPAIARVLRVPQPLVPQLLPPHSLRVTGNKRPWYAVEHNQSTAPEERSDQLESTNAHVAHWPTAKSPATTGLIEQRKTTVSTSFVTAPVVSFHPPEFFPIEDVESISKASHNGELTFPPHVIKVVDRVNSSNAEDESGAAIFPTTFAPMLERHPTDTSNSIEEGGTHAGSNGLSNLFRRLVHAIEPLRASNAGPAELEASIKSVVDNALIKVSCRSTSAGAAGAVSSHDGPNSMGSDGSTVGDEQPGDMNTDYGASTKVRRFSELFEDNERTIVVNTCLIQAGGPEELEGANTVEDDSFSLTAIQNGNRDLAAVALKKEPKGSGSAETTHETNEETQQITAYSRSGTTFSVSLRPAPREVSSQSGDPSRKTSVTSSTASTFKSCLKTVTPLCPPRKISFARLSEVQEFDKEVCPVIPENRPFRVATKISCFDGRLRKTKYPDVSTHPAVTSQKSTVVAPSDGLENIPVKSLENRFELGPSFRRPGPPLKLSRGLGALSQNGLTKRSSFRTPSRVSTIPVSSPSSRATKNIRKTTMMEHPPITKIREAPHITAVTPPQKVPVKTLERTPAKKVHLGPAPRRTAPPLKLSEISDGSLIKTPVMSEKRLAERNSLWSRMMRHWCPQCHVNTECAPLPDVFPRRGTTLSARRFYRRRNAVRDWISRHSRCWCG